MVSSSSSTNCPHVVADGSSPMSPWMMPMGRLIGFRFMITRSKGSPRAENRPALGTPNIPIKTGHHCPGGHPWHWPTQLCHVPQATSRPLTLRLLRYGLVLCWALVHVHPALGVSFPDVEWDTLLVPLARALGPLIRHAQEGEGFSQSVPLWAGQDQQIPLLHKKSV